MRADALRQTLRRAFPFASNGYEIVCVRSSTKRSEFLNKGNGAIILDDALRDVMRVLCVLLEIKNFHPGITYAVLHPLIADYCYNFGDMACAAYFAVRGLERIDQTSLLANIAFEREAGSDHEKFILLHEATHGMVSLSQPEISQWRDVAREALLKVADVADRFRIGGPEALGFSRLAGIEWEQIDQSAMERQTLVYVEKILQDKSIEEDVTCDVLAILGYANCTMSEQRMFEPDWKPLDEQQSVDLAVCFLQGLRTLKLEQAIAGFEQSARNVCSTAPPEYLEQRLLASTARNNALVHILIGVLQARGNSERVTSAFRRKIEGFFKKLSDRILTPDQDLAAFATDNGRFSEAFLETMGRTWPTEPLESDLKTFDDARNQYPY